MYLFYYFLNYKNFFLIRAEIVKNIKDIREIFKLITKIEIPDNLKKADLKNADKFIDFINTAMGRRIVIDEFQIIEPWAILLLAAYGMSKKDEKIYIENNRTTKAAKFACAMGLDEILTDEKTFVKLQKDRTVRLSNIKEYEQIEPVAEKISRLIIADYDKAKKDKDYESEDVRKIIRYVLVELMRNVIQHSYDPNGGLIVAQRMDKDDPNNPHIQIAVSDCGIGILQSLRTSRKDITDPVVALERSLWPGYSGKFTEYQTGTAQNAGMGLFFVSEIAKLTAGKFFIASKGATLFIQGDPEFAGNNHIEHSIISYEGTFASFEMPKKNVDDYDGLISRVQERARKVKDEKIAKHWIRFDIPKENFMEFVISVAAENTVKAEEFANNEIIPRIKNKQPLILNFTNIPICTQSFMHALIFNAVKIAYELKVPLYAKKATPTIIDSIKLVENYGL